MWNSNLSPEMNLNKNFVNSFKKYATISGIIFIILGSIGIVFPVFMTFTTVVFVVYLMLFAGLSSAWLTWKSNPKDWAGWLKSFALITISVLLLFYPIDGAATLGLLFAIYFFNDAFANFGLAFSLRPKKIWWMWLINAIISLSLGVIFLVDWPFSSFSLVGLFVGFSLLFDGIVLLSGKTFLGEVEKIDKDTKKEV